MPPLPLHDGDRVVELDPDQSQFTRRFTERAVAFIERNAKQPFFLYLPHVMPHVPIFASEKFKGRSQRGLFGDVVEELDWSVGEILRTLEALQLQQNTIVILFSDNGAWLSYGEHAGSNRPFREGKLTVRGEVIAYADAGMMRALMENLIGNAWKFTRTRAFAEIEVGARFDYGRPVFYVRDNGVGFDMRLRERLFMPFQRLHPAGTYEGSGLGLAAARRIVMRHGGTLDAEARLDLGATFYVWLPEEQ